MSRNTFPIYLILVTFGGIIVFNAGYHFFSGHKLINSVIMTAAYFGIFGRGMDSVREFLELVGRHLLNSIVLVGGFLLLIYGVFFLLKFA